MEHSIPPYSIQNQSTLAAIVITDGVAFSARMASDEEHTLSLIHRDLKLMRELCVRFEGQVLKSTGDGLLMYFTSAIQAVSCALEIQKTLIKLASHTSPHNVLVHRIGIHLGDVFLSEADVMGNGVNIAARLQTEAAPWGLCMSQTIYEVVKTRLNVDATYLGPLHLKNIQETVPAYQVLPSSPIPKMAIESSTNSESSPETLINQRYRIEKILGRGGFGVTYLASDTQRFDDLCVLKEFFPTSKTEYVVQKARSLFEREAKTLYQINHPQIPKFLAWFTDSGRLFIVQEYINGKTYSSLLKERKQKGRLFSEAEVVLWLKNLLPVLDYLHTLNIVHRDISPDNIMLPHGQSAPMLIDFGLVKQTVVEMWAIDSQVDTLVGQASFVGKMGYAPPEQIRMGQCFPCSDLYALGVTTVVFLTGKEPGLLMDQGSLEWQWQVHADVSDPLAQILNILLAEKPKDRYQTAREVIADLEQIEASSAYPDATVGSTRYSSQVMSAAKTANPSARVGILASDTPSQSQGDTLLITPDHPLIGRCQQELARCIGPMASCILNDVLTLRAPMTARRFVDVVAAEIPNSQQSQEFKTAIFADLDAPTDVSTSSSRGRSPVSHSSAVHPSTLQSPPPDSPTSNSSSSALSPSHQGAPSEVSTSHVSSSVSQPAQLNPVFISRCQHELARSIGPMASFVVDDVLSRFPDATPQEFIRAIATEIPDSKQSQEFHHRLLIAIPDGL
ncbi:MAG TPA: protein kinase domain-containing protein [Elainellaceae cyanobacterium]